MQVIGKDGFDLPLDNLVGFTCDGASVMLSSRQGVLGKLRNAINPKLFSAHCAPQRLALASTQKKFLEKTISDILLYFKNSASRRDQFQQFLELTYPDNDYIVVVSYHKVRWLLLSDCVSKIAKLLPSLVRFLKKK